MNGVGAIGSSAITLLRSAPLVLSHSATRVNMPPQRQPISMYEVMPAALRASQAR